MFILRPLHHPTPRSAPLPAPRPAPYYGHTTIIVNHPYYYHPYYWGPAWHPIGWFTATLATTAIIVSIGDAAQAEYDQYYYDSGVFYAKTSKGYTVVAPPAGAVITSLPPGYATVVVSNTTYYYYGGVFYDGKTGAYKVVTAPAGAIITQLPQGAQETTVNGQKLLEYQSTYYQPIMSDGKDAYEVVAFK